MTNIKKVEYWNSKKLCDAFNVGGSEIIKIEYIDFIEKISNSLGGFEKNHIPWNKGKTNVYSKETLELMKEAGKGRDMSKAIEASSKKTKGKPAHNKGHTYPHLQKGGKIISKDGEIVEFDCIDHISKKLNLNPSHLGSVLSGKRKSHKGWKNAS
jgi:hypothetical protein